MENLTTSHLLLLGCRYPDWLARMFLRMTRGRRLGGPRDETELTATPNQVRPLTLFLERFSTGSQVLPVTSEELIAALAAGWRGNRSAANRAQHRRAAAVHFSELLQRGCLCRPHAHRRLRQSGLDVWLDKGDTPDALHPGRRSSAGFASRSPHASCSCRCCRARRATGGRVFPDGVEFRRATPGEHRRGRPVPGSGARR